MALVTAYLSTLPPAHTTALVVLGAITPVVALIGAGMAFCHTADVAAARSWGR